LNQETESLKFAKEEFEKKINQNESLMKEISEQVKKKFVTKKKLFKKNLV
jgi:hypothetical protein